MSAASLLSLESVGSAEDVGKAVLRPCVDPAAVLAAALKTLATCNAAKRLDLDWQAQNEVRCSPSDAGQDTWGLGGMSTGDSTSAQVFQPHLCRHGRWDMRPLLDSSAEGFWAGVQVDAGPLSAAQPGSQDLGVASRSDSCWVALKAPPALGICTSC